MLEALTDLNHRRRALLERALDRPDTAFPFRSHGRAHDIAWVTARSDILELEAAGLLVRSKRGREFVFRAAPDLRKRLSRSPRTRA